MSQIPNKYDLTWLDTGTKIQIIRVSSEIFYEEVSKRVIGKDLGSKVLIKFT